MRIDQFLKKSTSDPAGEMAAAPPKVSIGMPLYNGEKYLAEALDCLRRQDFADYEVIISDNASTDDTATICRRFADAHPRVRFFPQERNIGAVPNFNFVLDKAEGEYFIWYSHDDGWAPDYLRKCVAVLDTHPQVVLCFSDVDFMDADGRSRRHEDFYGVDYNRIDTFGKPVLERIRTLLSVTNWYAIYGMYRTGALRRTRKGIPVFGWDVHLNLEILLLGESYILPEKLMRYRIVPKTSQQQLKDITNSDAAKEDTPYAGMARAMFAFLMGYGFPEDFKHRIREVFLRNFLEVNTIWRNEIFRENMGNLASLTPEKWVEYLVGLFPAPVAPPAAPEMRVLWQNRNDSDSLPGGDTTVVKECVANLAAQGTPADVSLADAPELDAYRIVHLNNISRTRDTLEQVRNAKRRKRPTVLTPLYEDMDRYLVPATKMDLLYQRLASTNTPLALDEIGTVLSRFDLPAHPLDNPVAKYLGIGDKEKQREILASVDCVLTSGEAESRSITGRFGPIRHMECLHFGFNRNFLEADGEAFSRKHGLKDFVLCVGRPEARKNQWILIEIFRTLPSIKLVLIGSFADPSLEKAIKGYAPPNVVFLERLPFGELVSAFGAARVHVLPSWYELPGLVSLEAAAAGCRIVSTSWGSARDYFQDRIRYCEPDDPRGIKEAILSAYDSAAPVGLREYVAETFGWDKTAAKLREIYARILEAAA